MDAISRTVSRFAARAAVGMAALLVTLVVALGGTTARAAEPLNLSLDGFYLSVAVIRSNRGEGRFEQSAYQPIDGRPWYTRDGHTFHVWNNSPENPYMSASLGYRLQWSARLVTTLDFYAHRSSIATNRDRGEETVTLRLEYFPFAKGGAR